MATIVTTPANATSAVNGARGGDTVLIRGGTHKVAWDRQALNIYQSGSPDNPITIRNYPGETVNFAQDSTHKPDIYTGCIDITASYIVLDGINVNESCGPALRIYSPNYKTSGNSPELWIRDITIQNCNFDKGNHSGFHFLNINGLRILNCSVTRMLCMSKRIVGWSAYPDHTGGLTMNKIGNLEIAYGTFGDFYGEGLIVDGFRTSGYSSFNMKIHDNVFYNGHPDDMTVYLHCISDFGYDNHFYNNVVMSTRYPYWLAGIGPAEYTPKTDWRTVGLSMMTSESYNRDQVDTEMENWRVYNNLILNNGDGLQIIQGGGTTKPIRNNWFYNNTFVNNNVALASPTTDQATFASGSVGNIFKNNVIYCQPGQSWYRTSSDSSMSSAFSFSNNVWYGGSNSRPYWGVGAGDVLSNPLLVNPDAPVIYPGDLNPDNYKPALNSPLVNAGMTSPYGFDFDNKPRQSGHDIGFLEASSTGQPPNTLSANSIKSRPKVGRPTADQDVAEDGDIHIYLDTQGKGALAAAIDTIVPGNTIWLHACDYKVNWNEQVMVINRSGLPGAPITIKAWPGDSVILRQDNSVLPPEYWYSPCVGVYASHIHIEGIRIAESSGGGITIHDDQTTITHTDVTIKDCIIEWGNNQGIFCYRFNNILIDGCWIHHHLCASSDFRSDLYRDHNASLTVTLVNGIEIKNSVVTDSYGEGIAVDGFQKLVESSRNISIHDNVLANHLKANVYLHGVQDYGTVNKFYNNIVYHTPQAYYHYNAPTQIVDWQKPGLTMLSSEVYVDMAEAPIARWDIYNNLIVQNGTGLNVTMGLGSTSAVTNNKWFNNTFVNNLESVCMALTDEPFGVGSGNNFFQNNVIINQSNLPYTNSGYSASVASSVLFSNNSWHGSTTPRHSWAVGSNDITVDPLLINPSASIDNDSIDPVNYTPTWISQLIDAGVDTGILTDYFGRSRVPGFDIGFAEFIGDEPPPDGLIAVGIKSSPGLESPGIRGTHNISAGSTKSVPKLGRPTATSVDIDNDLSAEGLRVTSSIGKPSVTSEDTFGELIQSKVGTIPYTATQNYISVTFDTTPKPGSLLVAAHYSGNGIVTPPTGWSVAFWLTQPIDDDEGGLFYKIAGPNESRTVTVTCAAPNEHAMIIAEFGGPYGALPLDVTTKSQYAVTDQPITLVSPIVTTDSSLVLGVGAGRDQGAQPIAGGVGFSPGYSQVSAIESTYKWVNLDFKKISTTGSQTATWNSGSYYSTGHHAGIAVFKQLVMHSIGSNGIFVRSEIEEPAIGQVHALSADDVSSGSQTGKTTLGQVHALGATSITSVPKLRKPKARYPSSEEALGVTSLPFLNRPVPGQTHILAANSIRASPKLPIPSIGQKHSLSGGGIKIASELNSPELTHIHALRANSVKVGPKLENPMASLVPKEKLTMRFKVYSLGIDVFILSAHSSIEND